ncbi:hypothetical protein L6164_013158 [Bauhinia variegata]|uniref:Uncharacterized protein n=1 Tax=Bauhinia variegata TaxID=167791 RepID=A0ACB9PCJ9_BAUVA|nr:hypothetical protein L6164_013158 [Bauhinia variegata]
MTQVAVQLDVGFLKSEEVPDCVVSSLKSVELKIYNEWEENVLFLAKYLLENSHVLKLMIVSIDTFAAKKVALQKVEEVLLNAPRASGSATIQIEIIDQRKKNIATLIT